MRQAMGSVLLCSAVLAGCLADASAPGPDSARVQLPSLAQALRHDGTIETISDSERAWMLLEGGWTQSDIEDLRVVMEESSTGKEGWSLSGVDGLTQTSFPTGEEALRAVIARERNLLLADLVERGEIDKFREFVRRHRGLLRSVVWEGK